MLKKNSLNVTVAIIEDDAEVRSILVRWVNSAPGFSCVGDHGSAESALARMAAEKPDIVLVDINLPGLNGVECVSRLTVILPSTQFIMLTVYEDSEHIFEALAAGAIGYLLKRTRREELIGALEQIKAGGSPMTGYIARKVVQAFRSQWKETPETRSLSAREREVLELLTRGHLYKEVCEILGITMSTVNTHARRIYEKLHVRSRAEAVARYTKRSFVSAKRSVK
jgi:DNA-binding NarL/FixJ family response regulator